MGFWKMPSSKLGNTIYFVLLVTWKYLHNQKPQSFYQQLKKPKAHLEEKKVITYSSHIHKIPGGQTIKSSPSVIIHHM